MAQHLTQVNVDRVSLVDRAAVRDPQRKSEPRRLLFWKREGTQNEQGVEMPTQQELDDALAKAETERERADKAEAELAKANEAKKVPDDEEVDQADEVSKADLPEGVRKALEKAEASASAATARAEAAEKIAKSELDRRVTAEFIAKAEEIPHVAGDAQESGPILKAISEAVTEEQFAWLEKALVSANAQIKQSELFKSFGSSEAGGSRAGGDVYSEIEQKAAELRKNDPNLSQGDAIVKATREDPDLQRRYIAAER